MDPSSPCITFTRVLYGPMDLVQMKLNELALKLNCDFRKCLKEASVSGVDFALGRDDRWSFTIQAGVYVRVWPYRHKRVRG